MADNGVFVESVEAALLSEIGMSSARMMKVAFLPYSVKKMGMTEGVTLSQPESIPPDDEISGPNAKVYVTKISTRTPIEEIKRLLKEDPGREEILRNYDFYTILLITSLQMDDPPTTRFINAAVEFVFPPGIKILNYSPKERGMVTEVIKSGGAGISISQALDFLVSLKQAAKAQPGNPDHRFDVRVGPEAKISGWYSKKTGYSFDNPLNDLLEYQVMLKNEHEVYGEIYPPMSPQDFENTGKENLAVFSFIIQAKRDSLPEIHVHMEARVKGDLWGVITLKGPVSLTQGCKVS